jgi:hypothetical protein
MQKSHESFLLKESGEGAHPCCFQIVTTELSTLKKDDMVCNPENIYNPTLYRKFANPYFYH